MNKIASKFLKNSIYYLNTIMSNDDLSDDQKKYATYVK